MGDYAAKRQGMVEWQIAARGVSDPAVLRAVEAVPREVFVPDHLRELAYEDTPLPIGQGQTISQPYIVARMAEALKLKRHARRVLEVGAGCGYAAAVLSHIAHEVITIERIAQLADTARENLRCAGICNVTVVCGDGTLGYPDGAPFDGIIVAAGGPVVPKSLRVQLMVGCRLVIPIGTARRIQRLWCITRLKENEFADEDLGGVQFVPLLGVEGWADEE